MTRSPAAADVTVVIPTRGRSPFFGDALASALADEPAEVLARRFPKSGVDAAQLLSAQTPIYTSATLVGRDAFLAVGGYDEALDAYEDLDLYLRLAQAGPLVPCPGGPVAVYRLHGENTP